MDQINYVKFVPRSPFRHYLNSQVDWLADQCPSDSDIFVSIEKDDEGVFVFNFHLSSKAMRYSTQVKVPPWEYADRLWQKHAVDLLVHDVLRRIKRWKFEMKK